MIRLIKPKNKLDSVEELSIEIIDSNGEFMVLRVLSGKNVGGEIFFDKKTLRFISNSSKSVVLLNSIQFIEFSKDISISNRVALKLHTIPSELEINEQLQSHVSSIGYVNEEQSHKIRIFFDGINLKTEGLKKK